jgi:hypothetical protein
LKLATLRRVAPAQTLPRGESGPEAGDGSAAQTCSSVHPAGAEADFGGVCVFKNRILGSASELVLGVKNAKTPRRAFAPGLSLWIFPWDTLFCLYRKVSYPAFRVPASRSVIPSERNVRNVPENIERMATGKIATHYTILNSSSAARSTCAATSFVSARASGGQPDPPCQANPILPDRHTRASDVESISCRKHFPPPRCVPPARLDFVFASAVQRSGHDSAYQLGHNGVFR